MRSNLVGGSHRLGRLDVLSAAEVQAAVGRHGSTLWGYLQLAEGTAGSPLLTPVGVVSGRSPGPIVYLGAGLHGDEYNAMEVVRRFLVELSPDDLAGTIIGVPIQNPRSFQHGSRWLKAELQHADLNRVFPGSAQGTVAERMAQRLFKVVTIATHVVDLHTASSGYAYAPTAYIPRSGEEHSEAHRIAAAFGVTAIVAADIAGSMVAAATAQGQTGVIVELGPGGALDPTAVDHGLVGMRNVLALLGMTHAPVSTPPRSWYGDELRPVRTEQSGFLYLTCRPGQDVRANQELARVHQFPDEVSILTAPCDGVVVRLMTRATVNAGDSVGLLACHQGAAEGRDS